MAVDLTRVLAGDATAVSTRLGLTRRVRRQPVEALLFAGAIGFLVGWVASGS